MNLVEVWKEMDLSTKLHTVRLLVEKIDQLSSCAMSAETRETREELRGLAEQMIEDCLDDVRDRGRYG